METKKRRATLTTYQVEVRIEPWEEGGYLAEAPALQGCWCVADTLEAAVEEIQEVIALAIASRLDLGQPLPPEVKAITGEEPEIKLTLAVCAA